MSIMLTKLTLDCGVRHTLLSHQQYIPHHGFQRLFASVCNANGFYSSCIANRSNNSGRSNLLNVRRSHQVNGCSHVHTRLSVESVKQLDTVSNAATLGSSHHGHNLVPVHRYKTTAGLKDFRRGSDMGPKESSEQKISDGGMMLYMAAENGYLSWMRNTYIMTVALTGLINLDLGSLAPTVCTATSLTAIFNMLVGSFGFISNLSSIRRRGHITRLKYVFTQLAVLLHFVFWFTVLCLLLLEFVIFFEQNYDGEDIFGDAEKPTEA